MVPPIRSGSSLARGAPSRSRLKALPCEGQAPRAPRLKALSCEGQAPRAPRLKALFLRGASPSRSPAEGSSLRGASPSRSPLKALPRPRPSGAGIDDLPYHAFVEVLDIQTRGQRHSDTPGVASAARARPSRRCRRRPSGGGPHFPLPRACPLRPPSSARSSRQPRWPPRRAGGRLRAFPRPGRSPPARSAGGHWRRRMETRCRGTSSFSGSPTSTRPKLHPSFSSILRASSPISGIAPARCGSSPRQP